MSKEKQIDSLMAQAQVFASAWSLVGGVFDKGGLLTEAENAKAELKEMLETALSEAPATAPAPASESVQAFRDYLGTHEALNLSGQTMDKMALELARIALDFKPLLVEQAASVLPTVELVGVKDGKETSLGQVSMPPTMKARELLREQGFTDIDDEMSHDACALWACESLIEYCQAYYAVGPDAQADQAKKTATDLKED